jgi:hypothetical protein
VHVQRCFVQDLRISRTRDQQRWAKPWGRFLDLFVRGVKHAIPLFLCFDMCFLLLTSHDTEKYATTSKVIRYALRGPGGMLLALHMDGMRYRTPCSE